MHRVEIDPSLEAVKTDKFRFPLGVYPVESLEPRPGYTMDFEAADGNDDEGDWEAWPDRYVFDAVLTADRTPALCRHLFMMLPLRVYPILDVIGTDAYREIDPYIAYDPVGLDRFLDVVRRWKPFFYEDGWCGFGAMCDDPFFYVFVDEHKIITIRCEASLRDRVEAVLHAFDLELTEEPVGADSAAHEHRSVLVAPKDRPELLTFDEVVEIVRDEWRLVLNVDPESNVDAEGEALGVVPWRCQVRMVFEDDPRYVYAEVLAEAGSLNEADSMAQVGAERLADAAGVEWVEASLLQADRLKAKELSRMLARARARKGGVVGGVGTPRGEAQVLAARWLSPPPGGKPADGSGG